MQLETMLSPASLAAMAAAMVAWMVSQAFGVGEVADVALLATGLGLCGWGVIDGFHDLIRFGRTAMRAHSEQDLDEAARYFASAVPKMGFNILLGLLFWRPGRIFIERGGFKALNFRPNLEYVLPPPLPGAEPTVTFAPMEPGDLGGTDDYGNIEINQNLSPEEQRITLDHETVHSILSPKIGTLREFRARVAASGYERVLLLRYLEEAMAETYALVRANGIRDVITGVTFPIKNGYLTITDLTNQTQGAFIGIVVVNGQARHVFFTHHLPQTTQSQQEQVAGHH